MVIHKRLRSYDLKSYLLALKPYGVYKPTRYLLARHMIVKITREKLYVYKRRRDLLAKHMIV